MSLGIYKKGQGYWTRLMSAIAAGTLILMGVKWLWDQVVGMQIGDLQPVYIQAGASIIAIIIFGVLAYYLIGVKPKVVDFMIATEGEMKKVNWSTRREVLGSTWVVIGLTVFIAIMIGILDSLFYAFFEFVHVLETAE